MTPTAKALAASEEHMTSAYSLWIISDEMSINRLTKPSTQTPVGICRMETLEVGEGLR